MNAQPTPLPKDLEALAGQVHELRAEDGVSAAAFASKAEAVLEALVQRHENLQKREDQFDAGYREDMQRRIQWRDMVDLSADGYLVTDPAGVIHDANQTAARMFGVPRERLRDRPISAYVSQSDWRTLYRLLADTYQLRLDGRRNMMFRLRPRGRPEIAAQVSVQRLRDDPAGQTFYRWMLTDCSEIIENENALQAERHVADSILDTAPNCILVLDAIGSIQRVNAYTANLLDSSGSALFGWTWWAILPTRDRLAAQTAFNRAVAADEIQTLKTSLEIPGERPRRIAWSLRRLRPFDRRSVIAVGHDITDIEEAQEKALHSERLAAIGQMVTSLAHESRNALQRMQGCLERLKWRAVGRAEELDLIARVQAAQGDLTRLFDDLRHYTAPMQLQRENVDIAEVWREAWQQATSARPPQAARLVETHVAPDTTCVVDRFRFVQVFRNLFDNSIESCDYPLIVTIECRATDGELHVVVRDNGPGFPDDVAERIFDPFFTTKSKGSGLGMAIARRVLDSHNGTIAIKGTVNAGTEVFLTIPRSLP